MYEHDLNSAFSKIKADEDLKGRIIERIEEKEMNKITVKRTRKAAGVLICAAVIGISTAFAASPELQQTVGNIISYFQSEKAVEVTDIEELRKYNDEIGVSSSNFGYTLTLDNVAVDDNFIHVFYTLKSDEKPFYEGDNPGYGYPASFFWELRINGELAGANNHNSFEGYYEDSHTYKAVEKYNIAVMDIPDTFKLELYGKDPTDKTQTDAILSSGSFGSDKWNISDEDKKQLIYISSNIDKSKVSIESVTKEINKKLWTDATVEKAIFSPFANQLVISTDASDDPDTSLLAIDNFALFDENGRSLDILNTDLSINSDGSSKNSFEFLKANKDTKQLKFVPIKYNSTEENIGSVNMKIGTYPLTYKISDYGSVVVTDIRITDGIIEIDYYKDGFVLYDPAFLLLDDNGENAEPGGKLGCTLYTRTHIKEGTYTAVYKYEKYDTDGYPIPADESVSEQNLKNSFTTLGVVKNDYISLDFDNAVTIDLK